MSDPILTLRKLSTIEDEEDHLELGKLREADQYALEFMGSGVLLSGEAAGARLVEAIDGLTGEEFCGCESCEHARSVDSTRNSAAFYIGLTAGLRLARATESTDGGAA